MVMRRSKNGGRQWWWLPAESEKEKQRSGSRERERQSENKKNVGDLSYFSASLTQYLSRKSLLLPLFFFLSSRKPPPSVLPSRLLFIAEKTQVRPCIMFNAVLRKQLSKSIKSGRRSRWR